MDSSSKNHFKFLILSHLIFVCKSRKKLLNTYGKVVKRIFEDMRAPSDFSFETMEVDQDHIHCLIKCEPRISLLAMVRPLKQESTFQLWKSYEADLKHHFWKEPFGVMATSVVRLAMPAKAKRQRFIHEAKDLVVFSPSFYKANRRKGNMTEKELRFTCAYTDCGKETTVIAKVSKPLAAHSKSVRRVYYCEHCNRANKIEVPDNVDVHVFILGRDKGFLRYVSDGIPLIQGEKEL